MPISKKNEDKKVTNDKNINGSKIFAIIMIIFVIGIATGAIFYTITNPIEPVANPAQGTNNTTIENNITPKEGYSLIKLGGLNFFVKNDCAEKYKKGDYFDSFPGGKDYHSDYERQAPWEKGPINNSQIVTINETNGEHKSFWLEISNIGDSSMVSGLDYKNNETHQDISVEIKEIEGNNVTIVHTGDKFFSQNIRPNTGIAIIEYEKKLIFMMWEGQPIDMYIIESFFKLN